jgi:hypothetical protein
MTNTNERFRPQTAVERELLAECEQIATAHGLELADVLADAVKFWRGPGRSIRPRQWRSRVTAAERLIARGRTIAEYATLGLDPFVEVDGFARMTAEQLSDEVVYLADYQA